MKALIMFVLCLILISMLENMDPEALALRLGSPVELEVEGDSYSQHFAAADNWLRANLRNYDTATLRWDTELVDGMISVDVNAQNGFGGYTGFETYTFRKGIVQ